MMFALFAIGLEGTAAMLCHYCDGLDQNAEPGVSKWDQEINAVGAHPDELIGNMPDQPGFHVWVGHRRLYTDYETGATDVDMVGAWSKASMSEVARFVHGAPMHVVFADRLEAL